MIATLYNDSGCDCLDGQIIPLTFDIPTKAWVGYKSMCNDNGCVVGVVIECDTGAAAIVCLNCNGAPGGSVCASNAGFFNLGTATCDPLFLEAHTFFQDLPGNECGAGEGHICCSNFGSMYIDLTL